MKRRRWPKPSASPSAITAKSAAASPSPAQPHPQTLDVVETRAEPLGIEVDGDDDRRQHRGAGRRLAGHLWRLWRPFGAKIAEAKAAGAIVIFVADPLALTIMQTPASLGADIAVGSMQRFGVPIGFGGPHAAYCAVSDKLTRLMPGRLVGQSVDTQGPARLPPGAADARAAYPPRQGDLQHLHRAGAARQHGDGLCHLARPGRPAGDRQRMCTQLAARLAAALNGAGLQSARRAALRHGHGRAKRRARRRSPRRPRRTAACCA